MTDRGTPRPDLEDQPEEGAFDPEMTDADEGNTPADDDEGDAQEPVERPL